MEQLDAIRINFNQDQLFLLNLCLAFIMFGVALFLKWEDFERLWKQPRSVLIGLCSQLLLLPLLTLGLIYILPLSQSFALGMLLVACCPGGNISNFASAWSHSNATLSVSLTSIVTIMCALVTPLSFFFWSSFLPSTEGASKIIEVSIWEMMQVVSLIIFLPIVLGLLVQRFLPRITDKVKTPINFLSILILIAFIVVALSNNSEYLISTLKITLWVVVIHNALGILGGYLFSKSLGESDYNARAIALETGIHNAGLGLVLIFNFFPDRGGMMIIVAWWGIWDIASALLLSSYWRYRIGKKHIAERVQSKG